MRDGDDTPDLALLLAESAGRRCQDERARSKRNENFSAIIHYVPPWVAIMPAYAKGSRLASS